MRSCAVAQHDPPKVCKPLLAASCDSSFLYVDPPISPSSIVLRILRFLYVSLQQRNLEANRFRCDDIVPQIELGHSSRRIASLQQGQPASMSLWSRSDITVLTYVQAL